MKSVIVHADGRRIDLASGITPEAYAELEATQGQGTQRKPLLFCGGCNGGVYVKHGHIQRDELFAAHYQRGDCLETLAITSPRMSDEHKRMQEYTVRAANDAGFSADTEVRTTRGTRVDVVVDSRIGFEVQLSSLTAGAAIRRTERSMGAGLEQVAWVGSASAAWLGKVPGYQWLGNGQVQGGMPPPRSVRSRGLVTFRAERSWRGGWEPVLDRLTVLVDDAVTRMATGNIRPVIYRGNVELVRADGIELYERLTGMPLEPFAGRAPSRAVVSSPARDCDREPSSRNCQVPLCGEPPRPYEDGKRWLCTGHAWQHYVFSKRTIQ